MHLHSVLSFLGLLSLCTLARAQTQSGPIIPVTQASCARFGDRLYFASGSVITGPTNWTTLAQFIAMDLSIAWDADTPVWHTLSNGPKALDFPSAFSADGNTMVTFRSGVPANGDPASSWLYSVQTNQWSYSKITVAAPNFGGLFPVTDPTTGLVYVAGGYSSNSNLTLNQMMIYNFTTDSYTLTSMPANGLIDNFQYQGVWWPKGNSILYYGGYVTGGTLNAAQITQFVPSTNAWSTLAVKNAGPPPASAFCMAIAEDGSRIVVFGGKIVATNVWTGALWVLDLGSLTWTQGQPYSTNRAFPGCTIVGSSTFVAWGGYNQAQTTSSSAIIYDLDTNTYLTQYTPPGSVSNQTSSSGSGGSTTKSSNSAPLIGGVIGGCAVVALIVGAFLLGRRKRRNSSTLASPPKEDVTTNPQEDHHGTQQIEKVTTPATAAQKENDSASVKDWRQDDHKVPAMASQQTPDMSYARGPQLYPSTSQGPQQFDEKQMAPHFSKAPQESPHLAHAPQHWPVGIQGGSPQFPAFYNASVSHTAHLPSPQVSGSVNVDH
ncbi:hypothetical protein EMPS_06601 [Entomortierella parvispora]|uniref:Galactose oxidase n=1 Tax=Entomortierella parvispora TaxID=205924 RepID=A0A9P3LXL9_9FUNG|nr:hypothetical protein EMPS_06601 [Entomortierella parvispora]